jgi:2-polyprenyl-3-methyl-5-hydroxy-6-metoxy-1,4-benzoquinol methylase
VDPDIYSHVALLPRMQQQEKEWFATWFDSEYYHLLYKNRSTEEAENFIRNLCGALQLPIGAQVLDLACGKGRHSRTLHQVGYVTTGVDLSEHSIAYAKQYETNGLQFAVHDMRAVLAVNYFDAVFNLFTSFGYMQTQRQNKQVASAMLAAVKPGGLIIVDFLNAEKLMHQFQKPQSYTEQRDTLSFDITKFIEEGKIFKKIIVKENHAINGEFQEQVQLLRLQDFTALLSHNAGLVAHYGSYSLDAYSPMQSDRLVMIFRKNK